MPPALTTASLLLCPHGGMVNVTPASTRVTAGTPMICGTDTFIIAGCAFNIAGVPSPCVSVTWVVTATRVKNGGNLALNSSSMGLCVNAAQAPQGPVSINSSSPRVNVL
jgi:hypothetical protein